MNFNKLEVNKKTFFSSIFINMLFLLNYDVETDNSTYTGYYTPFVLSLTLILLKYSLLHGKKLLIVLLYSTMLFFGFYSLIYAIFNSFSKNLIVLCIGFLLVSYSLYFTRAYFKTNFNYLFYLIIVFLNIGILFYKFESYNKLSVFSSGNIIEKNNCETTELGFGNNWKENIILSDRESKEIYLVNNSSSKLMSFTVKEIKKVSFCRESDCKSDDFFSESKIEDKTVIYELNPGEEESLGCKLSFYGLNPGIQKIEKKFIIVGEREIFNKTQ
jgi:hypothetical protein